MSGKGDLVKCSPVKNSELFYSVLGGLGQFGVITRARIPLAPAPTGVKRLRLLYNDFSTFTKDQEHLISFHERNDTHAADYVSGYILLNQTSLDLSFYPTNYQAKISSLVTKYGIIYSLELVKYYDNNSQTHIKEEVASLLKGLNYIPRFAFEKDHSYEEFQNRLHISELDLTSKGLWNVPHPWLNLFIPRSRISDFKEGVLKGIFLKQNIFVGTPSFFPTNRNKWDDRMSAVTPNEDVFYVLGLYRSSGFDKEEVKASETQNQQILQFCKDFGIEIKQYLASYKTKEEWVKQYGSKWQLIEDRKAKFDPKRILSPGQRIFN
ncbi:putative cytokinin dehydrogenase [Lupinus albus]|uniref:Putative cytokinin dehydrogenase n=1 Tax=Lupinus albus TaxID=3870 RepID=A0A6A4PSR0_LUPAL|nr:putative cytokinin dehydrogenase [Lupinus albus]